MFTKDRSFYHNFFSLYWILVLQNVIVLSVNLADNIMLGAYNETALSGVAAVNQIQFVLQQLMNGCGDSLVVLGSQYWGQRRIEPIRKLSTIALRAALLFAVLLFITVSLFPHGVLSLFTNDEAIIAAGMEYLSIIRFTYIIFAITTVLLASLRSVESVKIAFYISISALVINCCINYTLIYGHFGFPEMGAKGAAIGTLAARISELLIVCFYLYKKDQKLHLKLRDFLHCDRTLLHDYIHVCYPVIIVAGMWGVSTAMQTVILGHLQSNAIAANSVASTLFLILKVASVGASSCATIVIGKTIGCGDMHKVKEYTRTLQLMFLCIGLLTSLSLFLLKTPILGLYALSEETKYLANAFLTILCVTCIGTAYQMPVLTGLIRGGGDTRFAMINDIISIWLIVIPISFLAAFYFRWSPIIVVCCLNSDQIFKCVIAFIRVNSYKWVKNLTRA
ncbi:MATE family efflux transporter [Robinsoniella peoriensis]|uniref:MATE family efflux transporter n=1 Tax=Robinsoniella peoriensis TaxID=180332 RepID=UPI00085BBAE5|nr:MATE family efflux transporter [Robinsoniella peoriensis]